jgi:phosphoglycerol transferase MdoB-like AlkP superfamily enzyme
MKQLLARTGPLWVIACLFAVSLAWLTFARGALVAMHWSRIEDVADIWRVFPIGLRMDTIVLCELFAIPTLLYLLVPGERARRQVALVSFTVVAALLVHMELSTPSFIAEYDTRPDQIYFEYLRYPREVFGTLLISYPLQLLGVMALVSVLTVWFYRFGARQMNRTQDWSWRSRALCFPLMLVVMFIGARSTLGHRPANLSTASFSHNHLANELAVSSTYSLLNAIYMTLHEVGSQMYGNMDWLEVQARVARYTMHSPAISPNGLMPVSHIQGATTARKRQPNLVILVVESLGAGFVGKLGGLPLTPNLDRLSEEGLWFSQLYATGTRTVRGLEAIVTGFPPTPAQSVLKRPASQRDFFTLAALLQREGYATDFLYGGVSNFDNMGRFFRQNGFERVIEQKDFERPAFLGTWGVSDEDLIAKAHETFLSHGDEPFFALLLSTSNHDPFEFPAGRIALHEQPATTRNNAVKYTDYAIGKLFELARSAPYGRDTLFLVVADHDARVFGADLVPLERFHIPGLLIGPGVPRRQESRLASQIDLAPTLLGLMGITGAHPMIGRDILALPADVPGRALMQYADTNAFRVQDAVVIHQPHQAAKTYDYRGGRLVQRDHDRELERDALAHLLWADTTYHTRSYTLPALLHQPPNAIATSTSTVPPIRKAEPTSHGWPSVYRAHQKPVTNKVARRIAFDIRKARRASSISKNGIAAGKLTIATEQKLAAAPTRSDFVTTPT